MKEIQSKKNTFIKEIKKLTQKKHRTQTNSYLIDGWHLVQEALQAKVPIKALLVTPRGLSEANGQTLTGNWLILDNVQDPGNVGTMIRTADAAGFSGVFLGEGTADLYSTKVLRSMQGSNYHLQILEGAIPPFLQQLRSAGVAIYGTELNKEAVPYTELPKQQTAAFILGNEGQGVHPELLALTDKNVYIPIYGQAESLNVAIAAGILMYFAVS
ncbi:RNA methyltransferase [Enterococcus sp.]|uniref:TrmH family RNA methyltransferase n=1 Tax=Enterococcus sp. TaxID=35783 RepID=UPI00289F1E55|nr:RNA methyltransferase [Enterococcus sp.]